MKLFVPLAVFCLFSIELSAQVGIGTSTPHASAKLEVSSTTQGFLPPRMTRSQRELINAPAAGLIIWCSNCGTNGELQVYNGTSWTNMTGGASNPSLPVVTTTAVVSSSSTAATSGGNITNDGGGSIIARGVVWNTSPNPTVSLSTKTTDGTGSGNFTSSISGLTPSTTYYIRAYATNAAGTSYGSEHTLNLAIGQSAYGGRVAYIFQSGDPGFVTGETHGIIISVDQWNAAWGCLSFTNASGTAVGTGAQNTLNIVFGCTEAGTAAKTCADYSYTQNGIIYDDWHLPSISELQKVFTNASSLGGFNGQGIYWSSSQSTSTADRAFTIVEWVPGDNFHTHKGNSNRVRAVRFF